MTLQHNCATHPETGPHFLTDLHLQPIDNGRRWRLLAPLVYRTQIYVGLITVPVGFECDLNSMPRALWWLSPKTDYPAAGAVHDYLYATGIVERKVADQVYAEALEVLGAGRVRRFARFWAVRLFGRGAYKGDQ